MLWDHERLFSETHARLARAQLRNPNRTWFDVRSLWPMYFTYSTTHRNCYFSLVRNEKVSIFFFSSADTRGQYVLHTSVSNEKKLLAHVSIIYSTQRVPIHEWVCFQSLCTYRL